MIVLDTHAWIWWVSNPEELSPKARRAIDDASEAKEIYLSTMSVWEVAMLVAKKRLKLTMGLRDWLAMCESLPFFNFVPVNNAIALKSVELPASLPADPVDRIIIATALTLRAPLVTKDQLIRRSPHLKTLW